jgi:hypothetical protein
LALVRLRTAGECDVTLDEWQFDMDRLGDYRRRIKTVSVTLPAIVGQYGGVHATLAMTSNGLRVNDNNGGTYGDPLAPGGDTRFTQTAMPISLIATSSGQNDSGLFELSLADERYLPFEGAGAVSSWHLELPKESNAFDLATISDVILHLRYTAARSSNQAHLQAARTSLDMKLPPAGVRLLDLKSEFASEWYRFLSPGAGADQVLAFSIGREHLPFYARTRTVTLSGVDLFLDSGHAGTFDVSIRQPGAPAPGPGGPVTETVDHDSLYDDVHHIAKTYPTGTALLGAWTVLLKKDTVANFKGLTVEDVANAYLILRFNAA